MLEELESAFRDKIAEMRGLIALRQNPAASKKDRNKALWLEDLSQIEERVAGVEKLAEGLSQEVDEELKHLEEAREFWNTAFFEQKSELEALYNALPRTMRPMLMSSAASSNSSSSVAPSSSNSSVQSSSNATTVATQSNPQPSANTKSVRASSTQGVMRPPNRQTMGPSVQQPPPNKKQARGSKSVAPTTTGASAPPKGSASEPVGGALKPRHVTDAEVEKVPKYMRGRLTAVKCNEALDELSRLIDNRMKLLQLQPAAVARLKPPQNDLYQRAQSLQQVAKKSKVPMPKRFISELDLSQSETLRLDSMGKMLFSTLRHLGVIREFLCDNKKCFTLL